MGQQMGYRSLEWNLLLLLLLEWNYGTMEFIIIIIIRMELAKEATNIPFWAGIFDGAKLS